MRKQTQKVIDWRVRTKIKLVEHFGGKCVDCGYTGPAYVFDFDHRDPTNKEFQIGGSTKGFAKLLKEAEKCDLVCSNCHRHRTHRQRCKTCSHCNDLG